MKLSFSLHLKKKKNFTPGPSARVGIFNFGTDRVRVLVKTSDSGRISGIFAKKLLIRYFRVLEILIGYFRVHPNVVQFLYERFFNVTRRAYDGVDDDD